MKYEIRLATIEKKAPKGFALPATFSAFVKQCEQRQRGDLGWFAIKYTKPGDLLGFDAPQEVLPVLRMPDGGIVAFWLNGERTPPIIHCNSEGEAGWSPPVGPIF